MKLLSLLFFPAAFLYEEVILRYFTGMGFGDYHVALVAAFSLVYGLMTWLLVSLLRTPKARSIAATVSTALTAAVFSTEYTVHSFFKTFFDCRTMLSMGGDVTSQFADETAASILGAIPFIALSFVPLVLFWVLRKFLLPGMDMNRNQKMRVLSAAVALDILLIIPMVMGTTFKSDRDHFLYDYTAAGSIPRFGLVTALRMEATYTITGTPVDFLVAPIQNFTDPTQTDTPDGPKVYPYNVQNIDFAALQQNEEDKTLKAMHGYFGNMAPTQQNDYTGMFEGKNLVYLVCEAFCPYVIDPVRTPTLYKLSTEGFIFTNFYQPDWTMSTSGGEFAAVSGLVPTWYGGKNAFYNSQFMSMPYALGNQFLSLGYTTAAYHNHYADYYFRNLTHPNLGYDFYGINQGLELPSKGWPRSDLEMLQVTMPQYIDAYVNNGTNFHVYYMTVSGHTAYNFMGNKQAKKHKDEVKDIKASEPVQAYLACQLEVEYALTYLIEELEAAGIADDTVIALTSDHYPYALTKRFAKDHYKELSGKNTTEMDIARFENVFLLWSSSMSEPVVVDDPGSTIDILPTLSNLFGVTYDSRMSVGRDVLGSEEAIALWPDYSWVTEKGSYLASSRTFTPAEGAQIPEGYVERINAIVTNKVKFSRMVQNAPFFTELQQHLDNIPQ